MSKSIKNIGLFGFGQVGQGLYTVIQQSGYTGASIRKIVVKNKEKTRIVSSDLLGYDKNEILDDQDIDIIVEAIDDSKEAFNIVKAALEKKRLVVTSSKKMVAENFSELIELQKKHNATLLYEGSVCGSIPVIQLLDRYFRHEQLKSIQGIFNGTSNFILSRIFNENLHYEEALKQAQDLGFAESDPTNDVQAYDPKFKTVILAKHGFGVTLKPEEVINFGIDNFNAEDIRFAREHDFKLKVLATLIAEDGAVYAYVLPHFVGKNNKFYEIENEFNAVQIDAPYAGVQFYTGRGAGSLPTGLAVFNDVKDLVNGQHYAYEKSASADLTDETNLLLEIYFRYTDEKIKNGLNFISTSETDLPEGNQFIIGYVTLKNLKEQLPQIQSTGSVVIATGLRTLKSNQPLFTNHPFSTEEKTYV